MAYLNATICLALVEQEMMKTHLLKSKSNPPINRRVYLQSAILLYYIAASITNSILDQLYRFSDTITSRIMSMK